jgi:thioester reductase-like protein
MGQLKRIRVPDFRYSVDIFTTLLQGGCVCIPSEEDRRNDIIGAISRMRVNWALLTPSFASLIHPHEVPSLRTLVLGGEALTKECTKRWADKLLLINCYGPAECGACLTLEVDLSSHRTANNVGYSLPNSICWLAHPDDHHKLVPVGAVGELLVEGPNLARCYVNDEKKTMQSFIEGPVWANAGGSPRRFYKTGDLLKYNDDGSMDFVGRKDTQIKLRGQRVELGEVEHHISTIQDVAVSMVVAPKEGCYVNELVAIIQLRGRQPHSVRNDPLLVASNTSFDVENIKLHVKSVLPNYMVPTVCIVIQSMPFTSSLKVDRKMVVAWLERMSTRLGNEDVIHGRYDVLTTHESVAMRISSKIVEIVGSKDAKRRSSLERRDLALNSVGLDSIQIISLSMFLRSAFNVKLPLSVLLDAKTTIRSLAVYIEDIANGSSNRHHVPISVSISDEASRLGIQLANWMISNAPQNPLSTRPPPQNLLLTGATGFLGLEILKDLMTQSQLQVIVVVRTSNVAEGLDRIVNAARAAKWWKAQYSSRLSIWVGDLSEPKLGLSKIHWQQLTGHCHPEHAVHAIIHNGAKVHWNSDYLALKGTNVDSTLELLKSASISVALSSFVFISGGELPNSNDAENSSMADALGSLRPNTNGYSQSKLVSERLVEQYVQLRSQPEFHAPHQQHVSIIKPGYIIGTAEDGIANQNDFIWRLVAACIDINAYSEAHGDLFLFVASVQRIAHTVVASAIPDLSSSFPCHDETKEVAVPNFDGPDRSPDPAKNAIEATHSIVRILDGVPLRTFWTVLSHSFGYDLQPLPTRDWLSRLQEVVTAKGPSHVFFPFLDTLEQEKDNTPFTVEGAASDRTPERANKVMAAGIGREGATSAADYGDVEDVIRRNVEYLIDVGFLPAANRVRRA